MEQNNKTTKRSGVKQRRGETSQEQRVTRNALNLLSAVASLAEILQFPIIGNRIHIGFQSAAELIGNVQTAAKVVSDDALEASEEVEFMKSKLREL